jgi:phage gpG-like protein
MKIDVEVKGLIELQRKAAQMVRDLQGEPILNAMRDSVLLIQREARINAPVDTGRLRASITPEIRSEPGAIIGVVGSNVTYAAPIELGTRAFFPPTAALEVWARRHGMSAFVVARAISRRGLAARRYLGRAFEDATERIKARFEKALQEIIEK